MKPEVSFSVLDLEWDVHMWTESGYLPEPDHIRMMLAYHASRQTGHEVSPEWIRETVEWDKSRQRWHVVSRQRIRVAVIDKRPASYWVGPLRQDPLLWEGDQA